MRCFYFGLMLTLILSATSCQDHGSGPSVSASDIVEMIGKGKNVCISDKTITGKLDFTKSFPYNKKLPVSAVYIPVELCFRNCVFEDTVTFFGSDAASKASQLSVLDRNVVFDGCEFKSFLQMQQADFRGRLDFDNCKVRGESNFTGVHFRNGCSFMSSNFDSAAYFVSCILDGKGKFFKVLFKQSAVFQHLRIHDAVTFADSYFYGGAYIDDISAMSLMDFAKAKFFGNVTIANSRFADNLRLVSCRFGGRLELQDNTFAGQLDLRESKLGPVADASGNLLYAGPLLGGLQGLDSCMVTNSGNRLITTDIKPIF